MQRKRATTDLYYVAFYNRLSSQKLGGLFPGRPFIILHSLSYFLLLVYLFLGWVTSRLVNNNYIDISAISYIV